EVGLVQALRQRALSLSSEELTYEISAPDALPPLPAAVEVAAFRIASEAMTNVARHSAARRCLVGLPLDERLAVDVAANGPADGRPLRNGVGSVTMAERADELGGACTIAPRPGGGLVVRAILPLALDADPRVTS